MCYSEIFSLTDSGQPWIYLKGVPGYQLRLVLDFLYLGEVEVPDKHGEAHRLYHKMSSEKTGQSLHLSSL